MNKLYLSIIIIIIVTSSILGFIIYNENQSFRKEQIAQQQEIEKTKQQQAEITKEFEREHQQKEAEIQKEHIERMQKDTDGDGLTYEEEIMLNTDDNNVDTDGDGIWDNEDRHPAGGGKTHTITVYWEHNNLPFSTQFGIHEDKYWYYKDQPRGRCCDGWDKFVIPYDPVIQTIAQDIVDVSLSTGDACKSCIAIDFVESMTYQYDVDYNRNQEYPKYAIETIIDQRGDCEDTSFLMASILEALNYDTIIILIPRHVLVGVWCSSCSGNYVEYNGRNYFALETTSVPGAWEVGGGELEEPIRVIDV